MKKAALLWVVPFVLTAATEQTFTGVITDSMCGADHRAMKIAPDPKCIRECMKADHKAKFALYDGKAVYKLSDQETPARFAGEKVKVTGILHSQTGIIETAKITLAQ